MIINIFVQLAVAGFATWVARQAPGLVNIDVLEAELLGLVSKHLTPTPTPGK